MSDRRTWAIQLIEPVVGSKATAEMVLDILSQEGMIVLGYGDKDVDLILETFKHSFGNTKSSERDRWAAARLAHVHTSQAIVGIITLLGALRTEKFAPSVNSVSQLEDKLPQVMVYLRKQRGEEEINV